MYKSLAEVKARNKAIGQHFFSAGAMRFFNSRLNGDIIKGRYFVTSERFNDDAPRLYTLRCAMVKGNVESIGKFQQFATARKAVRFIDMLPDQLPEALEMGMDAFNSGDYGEFLRNAEIEPRHMKGEGVGYCIDTFCGACSWLCENYEMIDCGWMEVIAEKYGGSKG